MYASTTPTAPTQALALTLFDLTMPVHGLGAAARERLAVSFAQKSAGLPKKRKKAVQKARQEARQLAAALVEPARDARGQEEQTGQEEQAGQEPINDEPAHQAPVEALQASAGPAGDAQTDQAVLAAMLVFESAAHAGVEQLHAWLAKNNLPPAVRREALILAAMRALAAAMQSDYHPPVRFGEPFAAYGGVWIEIKNLAGSRRALQPGLDLWAAAGLPPLLLFAARPENAGFLSVLAPGRSGSQADGIHPGNTLAPGISPRAPGITSGDTLAAAGVKIWRQQFLEMLTHEAGTLLGEDIEELHDMRVATRRLRASFAVFGRAFEAKTLKPHLQGLRQAGRALGTVRDMDVLLEKAAADQGGLPELERLALAPLLQDWRAKRGLARQDLLSYLYSPDYQRFCREFSLFLLSPGDHTPRGQADGPQRVRELAPILIYTRLADVRALGENLEHATLDELHALRIEFKRFRYTVEFFREALGPEAKAVIDDLKQIQDHLGNMHDADVAAGLIEAFLKEWPPASQAGSPPSGAPIAAYLASRLEERQRLVDTFGPAWEHFNRAEFRRNLALAISNL